MKWLRPFIVAALCLVPVGAGAWWQSIQQVAISTTSTFQGPGDIVSGALIWGSFARVYDASLANTSTLMADLVDSTTGTVAVCTLRGSSTGFVDLTGTYCVGVLTPAAACLAAAGGACRVSKVYDQIGGCSTGWFNTINSQRPVVTFNILNGLPGLTGTSAANSNLTTSCTFTQAQPFTWVAVGERTTGFTAVNALIGSSGAFGGYIGFFSSASTVVATSNNTNNVTQGSAADSAFHAIQGIINGTVNSVVAADGTETTGNASTAALSSNTSRILRSAAGNSLDGTLMEAGLWPSGFTGTQRTNMNANIHGTSGYNF